MVTLVLKVVMTQDMAISEYSHVEGDKLVKKDLQNLLLLYSKSTFDRGTPNKTSGPLQVQLHILEEGEALSSALYILKARKTSPPTYVESGFLSQSSSSEAVL